jgi:hypothetical protein
MTLAILNYLLALAAIGLALKFGGKSERCGALIVVLMVLITLLGQYLRQREFESVDIFSLTQDAVAFILFSFIGINSRRIWPLWAAAFQLLSVGAHFVRVMEMPVRPIVYAWMKSGPTWAVLVLLLLATFAHRRRKLLPGNVPSSPN